LKSIVIDAVLWVLASPMLLAKGLLGVIGRCKFYRIAYTPRIVCRNCRGTISLVGMWRCGCGFTYRGHLLRECPVCHAWPAMVRCFECGLMLAAGLQIRLHPPHIFPSVGHEHHLLVVLQAL
jgi:hypothetical protein